RSRARRAAAVTAALFLIAACCGAAIAVADPDDFAAGATPASRPAARVWRGHSPRRERARPRPLNIYAHTRAGVLTPVTRRARYLVYAPDSQGDGVYVIDPRRYRVIRYFHTGVVVQHVVPAWDLRTLYATNDIGNSLTPI